MPIGQAKFGLLGGVVEIIPPLEHIETITANGDSFIEFTSIDESKYQTHLLVTKEYQQNSGSATQIFNPTSQLYESGVLQTGNVYYYTSWRMDDVNSYSEAKGSLVSSMVFQRGNLYNTSDIGHGYTYFYNLGNSNKMSHCTFTSTVREQNGRFRTIYGQATLTNTSIVDGIRIFSNGDFDGVFELYGLAL